MSDKTQTNIITFLFRNIHSGFSIHNVFMPIVHALNASYGEAPSGFYAVEGSAFDDKDLPEVTLWEVITRRWNF